VEECSLYLLIKWDIVFTVPTSSNEADGLVCLNYCTHPDSQQEHGIVDSTHLCIRFLGHSLILDMLAS
jgi:hypothetical protein